MMDDVQEIEKSAVFRAIVEVSLGGVYPFTEEAIACYMKTKARSIRKSMIRIKRKGLIEPIGFRLYDMSKDGMECGMAKRKREVALMLARGTSKSLVWADGE